MRIEKVAPIFRTGWKPKDRQYGETHKSPDKSQASDFERLLNTCNMDESDEGIEKNR